MIAPSCEVRVSPWLVRISHEWCVGGDHRARPPMGFEAFGIGCEAHAIFFADKGRTQWPPPFTHHSQTLAAESLVGEHTSEPVPAVPSKPRCDIFKEITFTCRYGRVQVVSICIPGV